MSRPSPADRARQAAEALAAAGQAVTARAVKQRAGVMTDVAALAARMWNDEQAAAVAVPPVPEAWAARVEALWPAAYAVAREQFADERAGLLARLASTEVERDELLADMDRAEEATAQARQEAATAAQKAERAEEDLKAARDAYRALERSTADELRAAETARAAAEGLVEGLRAALAALQPAPTSAPSHPVAAPGMDVPLPLDLPAPPAKEDQR